jgi:hypothetical protein
MQTVRHWSRATALAVVVLIVANRPTAAQSLASASVASWQRSLSDVHSGQAVRLGLVHRGRTEGRWVEASSPQPDSIVFERRTFAAWDRESLGDRRRRSTGGGASLAGSNDGLFRLVPRRG